MLNQLFKKTAHQKAHQINFRKDLGRLATTQKYKEQVDDAWKWIKEGTVCSMLLYNGNPISMNVSSRILKAVSA